METLDTPDPWEFTMDEWERLDRAYASEFERWQEAQQQQQQQQQQEYLSQQPQQLPLSPLHSFLFDGGQQLPLSIQPSLQHLQPAFPSLEQEDESLPEIPGGKKRRKRAAGRAAAACAGMADAAADPSDTGAASSNALASQQHEQQKHSRKRKNNHMPASSSSADAVLAIPMTTPAAEALDLWSDADVSKYYNANHSDPREFSELWKSQFAQALANPHVYDCDAKTIAEAMQQLKKHILQGEEQFHSTRIPLTLQLRCVHCSVHSYRHFIPRHLAEIVLTKNGKGEARLSNAALHGNYENHLRASCTVAAAATILRVPRHAVQERIAAKVAAEETMSKRPMSQDARQLQIQDQARKLCNMDFAMLVHTSRLPFLAVPARASVDEEPRTLVPSHVSRAQVTAVRGQKLSASSLPSVFDASAWALDRCEGLYLSVELVPKLLQSCRQQVTQDLLRASARRPLVSSTASAAAALASSSSSSSAAAVVAASSAAAAVSPAAAPAAATLAPAQLPASAAAASAAVPAVSTATPTAAAPGGAPEATPLHNRLVSLSPLPLRSLILNGQATIESLQLVLELVTSPACRLMHLGLSHGRYRSQVGLATALNSHHVAVIADILRAPYAPSCVDLEGNAFNEGDAVRLVEAIGQSRCVMSVALAGNPIGSGSLVFEALARTFPLRRSDVPPEHRGPSCAIDYLSLSGSPNQLLCGNGGGAAPDDDALCTMLAEGLDLDHLELSYTFIGARAWSALRSRTLFTGRFSRLVLRGVWLDDPKAADLAKLLQEIDVLDLSDNLIGCEGAIALAARLQDGVVSFCNLSKNQRIGQDGRRALASAVSEGWRNVQQVPRILQQLELDAASHPEWDDDLIRASRAHGHVTSEADRLSGAPKTAAKEAATLAAPPPGAAAASAAAASSSSSSFPFPMSDLDHTNAPAANQNSRRKSRRATSARDMGYQEYRSSSFKLVLHAVAAAGATEAAAGSAAIGAMQAAAPVPPLTRWLPDTQLLECVWPPTLELLGRREDIGWALTRPALASNELGKLTSAPKGVAKTVTATKAARSSSSSSAAGPAPTVRL